MSPAFVTLMKPIKTPLVPTISNVFWTESVRPPRLNSQPPLVTSMFSLIVTAVAVHGPLGGAHSTFAVLVTGSGPQVRATASASGGRAAMAPARRRAATVRRYDSATLEVSGWRCMLEEGRVG